MKMHPADISKEIKGYSFFKSFSDDWLLQVCAMVHTSDLKAGEFLLKEGQANDCLYFLRKGKVDVSLAGEILATLENPGEIFGEMSVITANPTSTTVKALSESSFFFIRAKDFAHVHPKDQDRFQALLYKIYCHVLTDRLMKTNEKARLFEI
ncbi:MAG TPA: cyclic nucleotide-binding domain-containing protein, partial [Bdellovibrio sp.]|nr:cyclic nucleotide-binding domain-containing protein [Bdellovibrio sp.]